MSTRDKLLDGTTRITGGRSAWPVGSIYLSMVSTNPGAVLGGTWVRFGQGRMPISLDESDPSWDTAGDTGGEKYHLLDWNELPPHFHDMTHDHPTTLSGAEGEHTHEIERRSAVGGSGGFARGNTVVEPDGPTKTAGNHGHVTATPTRSGNTGYAGAGEPHNNMPPYIAVYMWRRTA